MKKINKNSWQLYITLGIVLLSFLIRVIRLDIPHDWSFDEVYHALSAEAYALNDPRGYEWWNPSPKDLAYEWLHPPLGKLFMAASIKIFAQPYIPESKAAPLDGLTTFAWRFPGVIFASLTVYLLIIFGKRLFDNFWIGAVAGLLYALDGLSFVQSRTGMNDIFITYFVVLTFYRLYVFIIEYPRKNLRNLIWLGLAAGLAASTKWTGFYAVAIVFVAGVAFVLKKRDSVQRFVQTMCILAFVPAVIYVLSYGQWWIQGHTWKQFTELHQQIWWYQTGLKATHGYQSAALSWPLLIRPVWFYVKYEDVFTSGQKELYIGNIYTMGHPLIWWGGLAGIGFLVWSIVKKHAAVLVLRASGASRVSAIKNFIQEKFPLRSNHHVPLLLILSGYFGMFLPWAMSPRIMFLYHYLPSIPFLCLALAYGLFQLKNRGKWGSYLVVGYLTLVVAGFVYFYPHWSAVLVPQKWAEQYYWLKSWK